MMSVSMRDGISLHEERIMAAPCFGSYEAGREAATTRDAIDTFDNDDQPEIGHELVRALLCSLE